MSESVCSRKEEDRERKWKRKKRDEERTQTEQRRTQAADTVFLRESLGCVWKSER